MTAAPAVAGAHEAASYGSPSPLAARAAAPVLRAFDRARLRMLRRLAPPPAVLVDAGAGRGRFVASARAAGYDARGIEPSARGAAAARSAYGVELERAGIADAAIEPGTVGVVTLWHVLEHVDDPAGALRAVASWLRRDGVLLVGVPNLASVQARLAGPRWFHLDPPRHRVHFTVAGLRTLLRRCGFEPVRERHVLAEHNPFGMWVSLVPTRTPAYAYQALERRVGLDARDLAVTLACLPLLPLAATAEAGAGLLRRGGTVAVVARRVLAP